MNKYIKLLKEAYNKIEAKNQITEAINSDGSLDTNTTTYAEILDKPVYLICALTDDSDFWWSPENKLIAGDTGSTRGNLLSELKVFPSEEAARNYAVNYIKTNGIPEVEAYWDVDDALGLQFYTSAQTLSRATFDKYGEDKLDAPIANEDIIAFDHDWDSMKEINI